jgi:hypothetical protein
MMGTAFKRKWASCAVGSGPAPFPMRATLGMASDCPQVGTQLPSPLRPNPDTDLADFIPRCRDKQERSFARDNAEMTALRKRGERRPADGLSHYPRHPSPKEETPDE